MLIILLLVCIGIIIYQAMYYAKLLLTLRQDNVELTKRLNEEVKLRKLKVGENEIDKITNY